MLRSGLLMDRIKGKKLHRPQEAYMTKASPSTGRAPDVDKILYTPLEAAHALGVSRSTVYELMAAGTLPSVRIGASRRVPVRGLLRYVSELVDAPGKTGAPAKSPQQRLWP